jgi:GTP-binding protein EngB required for normal cell division
LAIFWLNYFFVFLANYKPPKDHEDADEMTKFLREEGCSVETLIEKKDKIPSKTDEKRIKEERTRDTKDSYKNETAKTHRNESSRVYYNDSHRHSKEKRHRRSRSRSRTRSPPREKRDQNHESYKKHSHNYRN